MLDAVLSCLGKTQSWGSCGVVQGSIGIEVHAGSFREVQSFGVMLSCSGKHRVEIHAELLREGHVLRYMLGRLEKDRRLGSC
jgi:hypothetical protein